MPDKNQNSVKFCGVEFAGLRTVALKVAAFFYVTLCSPVEIHRYLG
jgi:hypothetical protein